MNNQEPAAETPARALGADELSGVAGGAPPSGGKVCVMTCETCGAQVFGQTPAVARAQLIKHKEYYKH